MQELTNPGQTQYGLLQHSVISNFVGIVETSHSLIPIRIKQLKNGLNFRNKNLLRGLECGISFLGEFMRKDLSAVFRKGSSTISCLELGDILDTSSLTL